ncbi:MULTISPECIES: hypothetical protein [Pseudothermotoga]|jgi:hypothetical protein|uniref:DUF5723 domain-containing protein n=1 Tax=Pseudothermotoga lettingae (strain ATCC BAA-301 / DSM 14385 / NBRC 107922 / TMO) TaxID=416591 RepID=A8F3T5_PSELT|nr:MULTISPECIES: hypothetical protein [Pseudothermotoga]ABV32819.1 hypothetical protein Tlet_0249 [Pseudothermotoga lettingae TMO]KUK19943.1 MAG: Uncharacterized protein XD56_2141 [Pseudothermotoga lettingae]GLI48185.1 hypothetical protein PLETTINGATMO_03540 [Pseudothermotoga lettingae TMO]HBJ81777.1 hypothetical protein [Pseudothermotoga sp.]
MKKFMILILCLLFVTAFSYQWEVSPGFFKPVENLGMGGTYVTTSQGLGALILNPALYTPGFEIISPIGVSNNVMSISKLFPYISNPSSITELASDTEFLVSMQGVHSYDWNIAAGYGSKLGNISLGGMGAFQTSAFWNLSLMRVEDVELGVWASYFGVFGGSFKISNLKIGASVGGGMAGFLVPATGTDYPASVNLLDENSFENIVPDDVNKIFSNINNLFFTASAGVIYDISNFRFGASLFYNSNDVLINSSRYILSIGASYNWQFLTVAAELEDLLNQEKSIYRKLNLGLSTDFGIVKLFGGLHAGWLTGGVKLDIPFVKIGFTAYVYEYSKHAGIMGEQRYILSFDTKF